MRRVSLCLLTIVIGSGQSCGGGSSDSGGGGNSGGGDSGPNPANTVVIFDNTNIYAVSSNPSKPTQFTTDRPYTLTYVQTNHWNDGKGTASAGTISLRASTGGTYGPWQTTGDASSAGAPNVNWACQPNIVLPAGTYTVVDSDPSTWSQNAASGYCGICIVEGIPQSIPEDNPDDGTPLINMWQELYKRPYVTVHFDDGYADSPAEGDKHYEDWKAQIAWSSVYFTTTQRIAGGDIIGTLSTDGTKAVTIQATDQSAAAQGSERSIILNNMPYVQGPAPGDETGSVNMVFAVNGDAAKSHVDLRLSAISGNVRWTIGTEDITTWYKSHVWVSFSAAP
jgi:hypothetical protein